MFEELGYYLPVQTWLAIPGFQFGIPEGWAPSPAEELARNSALTRFPTLIGAELSLADGNGCSVTISLLPKGVRSTFIKGLRSTDAKLAAGYRSGGVELLAQPHRILIDGEPSIAASIQHLSNGVMQYQCMTGHQGRFYMVVYEASQPYVLQQHIPDFYTMLASWRWS